MKAQAVTVIGAIGVALTLALACRPEVNEKVTGDRETCEVYCSRYIECKDPSISPSVKVCTDDCVESPEWTSACAEEYGRFMTCATAEENSCPTFEHVGLAEGENSPCYDENYDHSICLNKERP